MADILVKPLAAEDIGDAAALAACLDLGIRTVHVDYEAANPAAARFWPRTFTPVLLSVRRTLMRDFPSGN
jgi:hypothetical protein